MLKHKSELNKAGLINLNRYNEELDMKIIQHQELISQIKTEEL